MKHDKMDHQPGSKVRRTIVVTGPPRSGTTPVGDVVAHIPGAVSLYEPWGPTGDVRLNEEFPIVGTGTLSQEVFESFLNDLARLKLQLGQQVRPSHQSETPLRRMALKVTGSRSLHSYRLARLQPFSKTVIWKDPHAFLSLTALLDQGISTVVTLRSPFAGAASYKRMGWATDLPPIYARYKERYGADAIIEDTLKQVADPVRSAATVWRMGALLIKANQHAENLFLVRSTDLETKEDDVYAALFDWLGIDPTKPMAYLAKRQNKRQGGKTAPKATHDWTRSLKQTNAYWRDSLTEDEIRVVTALAGDLSEDLLESN